MPHASWLMAVITPYIAHSFSLCPININVWEINPSFTDWHIFLTSLNNSIVRFKSSVVKEIALKKEYVAGCVNTVQRILIFLYRAAWSLYFILFFHYSTVIWTKQKVMKQRLSIQWAKHFSVTFSKLGEKIRAKRLLRCRASVSDPTPISIEGNFKKLIKERGKKERSGGTAVFPFVLTVEDLERTTATTSWISSARVGAPCPLRKSGPCSSGWGISRCPKSLFVSLGRSCALPARGGAERASPGSAASTDVWAPLHSRRFRRRRPKTSSLLSRRQGPSSFPRWF